MELRPTTAVRILHSRDKPLELDFGTHRKTYRLPPDTDSTYWHELANFREEPYFINAKKQTYWDKHGGAESDVLYRLENGEMNLLDTPYPYSRFTYADESFLLGVTHESLSNGEFMGPAGHPFVHNIRSNKSRLIKYIQLPKKKGVYGISVEPKAISPDGQVILCDRIEHRLDRYGGPQTSVVIFRKGQAEVLSRVQVGDAIVQPTRVKDARGRLAVLEGTTAKGKPMTFLFWLE